MAEIYDRYGAVIYSISLHILKNSVQAERLVSEILLDVWRMTPDAAMERGLENYVKAEAITRALRIVRSSYGPER